MISHDKYHFFSIFSGFPIFFSINTLAELGFFLPFSETSSCQTVALDVATLMVELDLLAKPGHRRGALAMVKVMSSDSYNVSHVGARPYFFKKSPVITAFYRW